MALISGAGAHLAWISVSGGTFPIEKGTVEQHAARKSSTFHVTIPLNFPGARAAFENLGGNSATITVLTRGITATLLTGEVDRATIDYIGGFIHATGRDIAAQLHANVSNEKWVNKQGSNIVQDLLGRLGISVDASTSSLLAGKLLQQDYVKLSDNQSFGYIVHKLAEFDGARWWVDGSGSFHYVDIASPSGIYSLNYSAGPPYVISDCMALRVTKNIQAGKDINVTVKSWHPYDKQTYTGQATVGGNGGSVAYSYPIPNLKQDHVDKHAKSRANEAARHELTVDATVAGDPTCNASMGLQLNGTGAFDQLYVIDCVSHHIGKGHTTHITARSASQGRSAS